MERICFKADIKVTNKEDELTNPGIYGKEISKWLKEKLEEKGYKIEDLFPEDWGWCIVIHYKPFFLCVACNGEEYNGEIIWSCFVNAEKPFFRNPFKKLNIEEEVKKLERCLYNIIKENFKLVDCP
jgi:hypothetical protein